MVFGNFFRIIFSRNTFVLVLDRTDVFKVIHKRIFETNEKINNLKKVGIDIFYFAQYNTLEN